MSELRLILGDCLDQLRELDAGSVHAVVTDPPYGISFMDKHWDRFAIEDRVGKRDVGKLGVRLTGSKDTSNRKNTARTASAFANAAGSAGDYDTSMTGNRAFQAWVESWGVELLRVLKPGGHCLVFGGTRTYHRLAAGLEDAGFEIRDTLAWMFGQGFPKSLNLDGDWEGWGTALKPAFEPIVVARKPLAGTVAANVLAHGTGALNIGACRVAFVSDEDEDESKQKNRHGDFGTAQGGNSVYGDYSMLDDRENYDAPGRWPANVILDDEAAALLDEQTGDLAAGNHPALRSGRADEKVYGSGWSSGTRGERRSTETGGASRFFYCAKVSRAERNAGLSDGFEPRPLHWSKGEESPGTFQRDGTEKLTRNHHPTVKPIALMRWLIRLVTPGGGLVLDPFIGSGSTGCAAVLEGVSFIGIEREPDYLDIARARITWWSEHGEAALDVAGAKQAHRERLDAGQLDLLIEPTE